MSPPHGRSRPRQGGSTTNHHTTTRTAIKTNPTAEATVTVLTARLERVRQTQRKRHVLREVSEAAAWLRMIETGQCPIDSGIFEAHRSLNQCVIDLCKNGGLV